MGLTIPVDWTALVPTVLDPDSKHESSHLILTALKILLGDLYTALEKGKT